MSPNGEFVHEAALGVYKGRHTIYVSGVKLDAGLWTGTGAGTGTGGPGFGLSAGGYGHGLGLCVEFELTAGEFVVSLFVLEEDDFTESLGTELEPDGPFDD